MQLWVLAGAALLACGLSTTLPLDLSVPVPWLESEGGIPRSTRFAMVQRSSQQPGNASSVVGANVVATLVWAAKAAAAGAEVVVFPELNLGLDCSSRTAAAAFGMVLGCAWGGGGMGGGRIPVFRDTSPTHSMVRYCTPARLRARA
jgi:hypothetical protein